MITSPSKRSKSELAGISRPSSATPKESLTYASAGVDIEMGDAFVEAIKPYAKRTMRPEVKAGIGGFGSLCAIPQGYKNPILVSGTDGIGTKLKFGLDIDQLDTLGIDLVAMCVNDILTLGAEPLFFLDYYATGKLELKQAVRLVKGIAKGCELAGCALIGGETAEMPGLYQGRDFDMAGFAVGVAESKKILSGDGIKAGDVLIGLASSGAHSNGYSLIRRVLAQSPSWKSKRLGKTSLASALIAPTRIYTNTIRQLRSAVKIKGLAHITGGGLIGNVPRILPKNLQAMVLGGSWAMPPLFSWLQEQGNISNDEMLNVFNLGIGMVAVLSQKNADKALHYLHSQGEQAWIIGEISSRSRQEPAFTMMD
jgi:phosphoribosylformylglycinamidine cyclo-ligase